MDDGFSRSCGSNLKMKTMGDEERSGRMRRMKEEELVLSTYARKWHVWVHLTQHVTTPSCLRTMCHCQLLTYGYETRSNSGEK